MSLKPLSRRLDLSSDSRFSRSFSWVWLSFGYFFDNSTIDAPL
jgi:hypothetical protein